MQDRANKESVNYCEQMVRNNDYDLYLVIRSCPLKKQTQLFILGALQCELSRIRYVVSEPTLGLIRLQWWRENVAKIYQGVVADHPVIKALAILGELDVSVRATDLARIINGFELDVEGAPVSDYEDLKQQASRTIVPLLKAFRVVLETKLSNEEEVQLEEIATMYQFSRMLLTHTDLAESYKEQFISESGKIQKPRVEKTKRPLYIVYPLMVDGRGLLSGQKAKRRKFKQLVHRPMRIWRVTKWVLFGL